MEKNYLSLLFPSEESALRHSNRSFLPAIDEDICSELGLDTIFALKNRNISDFFTADPAVIRYRQEVFADMQNLPILGETLSKILPVLYDILSLRQLDLDFHHSGESYLYSITEIELYVGCISMLYQGLKEASGALKSYGFTLLYQRIEKLVTSTYYQELNQKLNELSSRIREVRSVTIGVNLDNQLRPTDAGVLSINAEPFKSGKVLDKILRMSFRNDARTCIASLVPFGKGQNDNRKEALVGAFSLAIDDIFRSSVRQWRAIVGDYVLENTDFLLRLLPEIEFLHRGAALHAKLLAKGCKVTPPVIAEQNKRIFSATGLYQPSVALQIDEEVVTNDFAFDENASIYILTGPNRGGKSVITCAVGIAQALAQLGLCVPASTATISPVDAIFVHFPTGADDTIDKGRLGEECARLKTIFEKVTPYSMILLDESLSSTGAYEATVIAEEILSGFALSGCRGIFSTHLHELALEVDAINEKMLPLGGVPIDNLVAGMEEGARSFIIKRKSPDGKSYARDIVNKYGLSFDAIASLVKQNKKDLDAHN